MTELIMEILPFAVGVFASPLPVIVTILLLFSAQPRRTATVYVTTWIVSLTVLTAVLCLIAGALEDRERPPWLPWLRVLLGAGLLVMAAGQWRRRHAGTPPRVLSTVLDAGPRQAVRLGVVMSAANPKEVLMAVPTALAVGASGVPAAQAAVAVAVFVLVGAASVAAPLLLHLALGDSSAARLAVWRDRLQDNSAVVTAVVLGGLGLWLLVGGATAL